LRRVSVNAAISLNRASNCAMPFFAAMVNPDVLGL
jgi:hypothetical protein